MIEYFPTDADYSQTHASNATKSQGLVTATEVPDDANGGVSERDIRLQAESVLTNLDKALRLAGSSNDAVMHLTIYLVNIDHRTVFNDVYRERFTPPFPARACIAVAALAQDSVLVEVTAIASVERPLE